MNNAIHTVISGGQTGADQAAWDAARECRVNIGGFVPRDFRNEQGKISAKYFNIQATDSEDNLERTQKNVENSDATLIVYRKSPPEGGTAATIAHCERMNKPCLRIEIDGLSHEDSVDRVAGWLANLEPRARILNVAGPRHSEDDEIYDLTFNLVRRVLMRLADSRQDNSDLIRHMHADLKADFRHWDQIRWLVPTWYVTLLAAIAVVVGSGQIGALHWPVFVILGIFGLLCNLLALRTAIYHSRQIARFRKFCDDLDVDELSRRGFGQDLPFSFDSPAVLLTATLWFHLFILFTSGFCFFLAAQDVSWLSGD